jgi:hypothetical protein
MCAVFVRMAGSDLMSGLTQLKFSAPTRRAEFLRVSTRGNTTAETGGRPRHSPTSSDPYRLLSTSRWLSTVSPTSSSQKLSTPCPYGYPRLTHDLQKRRSAHWHRLQYWFRLTLGRYPKQSAGQLVWLGSDIESVCDGVDHLAVEAVEPRCYNDTANTARARQSAMDRQAANGLGEYHSEATLASRPG